MKVGHYLEFIQIKKKKIHIEKSSALHLKELLELIKKKSENVENPMLYWVPLP